MIALSVCFAAVAVLRSIELDARELSFNAGVKPRRI
jgi:hypothetical protein